MGKHLKIELEIYIGILVLIYIVPFLHFFQAVIQVIFEYKHLVLQNLMPFIYILL